jgi:sterol carrier protein 2
MAPKTAAPVYVLGVGMTKFVKPRRQIEYTELCFEAGVKAMLDAKTNCDDVDQGIACYVYRDSACGQLVFYQVEFPTFDRRSTLGYRYRC